MKLHKWLDRRLGFLSGAAVLLLGVIVPAAVPALASAATLEERSIQMSSSKAGETGVSYELKLTDVAGGIPTSGGLIVEFCDDSAIIGASCQHPSGMSVSGVSASTGTATDLDSTDHTTIEWVPGTAVATDGSVDVTFSGITNPDPAATPYTFYARITTYTSTPTSASNYQSATSVGSYEDDGAVALGITKQIGITAYVMETLSFCVSGNGGSGTYTGIGYGCAPSTLNSPSMTLGEEVGSSGVYALDTSHVSTGTDWAQLSTNAAGGAVVNLKSNATSCGGLVHAGDGACGIKPQDVAANTISNGDALFGLTIDATGSDPTTGTGTSSGTLHSSGSYSSSNYFIDYDTSGSNATGVTSPYGSELFNSNNSPVSNKNMSFTFGASTAVNTPAGQYGADLSLVATGTF